MAREFRAYEWVDGDLTLYQRQEGEDDSGWVPVGRIKFEARDGLKSYVAVAEHLGLNKPIEPREGQSLWNTFVSPRRW